MIGMSNLESGNANPSLSSSFVAARSNRLAVIERIWSDHSVRALFRGVAWTGGAAAIERLVGLVQAYYVARLLGIDAFGKYGLLFTTIALVSMVTGLQLGLTATVQISRYLTSRPHRAAAVMRLCEFVTLSLSVIGLVAILFAPEAIAHWLLDSPFGGQVIVAGALIALFAVAGGVQEAILQGFEEFARLSIARVVTSLLGFVLLLIMGRAGDLTSVITAIAVASMARTLLLFSLKEAATRRLGLRTRMSEIIAAAPVIVEFSIPSLLISLVSGLSQWYGLLMVKQGATGFRDLAFVTVGVQWRSAVVFATTILASVAVPMMSRLLASGDTAATRRIHRLNIAANLLAAGAVVAVVLSAASHLLAAYGDEFQSGQLPFTLVVTTSLPGVYIVVLQNLFVSQGRMFEVLMQTIVQGAMQIVVYWVVVPRYGVSGFAAATLFSTFATCVVVHIWVASSDMRTC